MKQDQKRQFSLLRCSISLKQPSSCWDSSSMASSSLPSWVAYSYLLLISYTINLYLNTITFVQIWYNDSLQINYQDYYRSMIVCLALIFFYCGITNGQLFFADITSSSTLAGSSVTHFITTTFTNYTVNSGYYLFLNYSAGWTVSTIARANSGDFCQNLCNLGAISLGPHSGNNIRINNIFPSTTTHNYTSIGLSLSNVFNPRLAMTDTVSISLLDGAGTLLQSVNIQLLINPSPMTCGVSFPNTTVTATNDYTFTVTPNPNVPLSNAGSLDLKFPSKWSNSLSGPAFSYSSCSNSGGPVPCSVSGNTLTASNLFAVATTTSAFSFTLSSVDNPGSTQPNSQLQFDYKLSNGSVVGTCSVLISGLQPTTVASPSFTLTNRLGLINFTSVVSAMNTDEVLVTFPAEYSLEKVQLLVQKINGNILNNNLEMAKITNQNQLLLRIFIDQNINFYELSISQLQLMYPTTAQNINIDITRFGYIYSTISCCSNTLAPGQNMSLLTTISDASMRTTTSYLFTLTFAYLPYTNYLLLQFCGAFALVTNQQYSCYFQLYVGTVTVNCTATNSSILRVQLANSNHFFSSILGFSASYVLVVDGITNPSQTVCSVSSSAYLLPSNLLEYSSNTTLSFSPTKIIEATLSLSDPTVGATSTYTFVVNNTNALVSGTSLHIYFPKQFNVVGLTCTFDGAAAAFTIVNSTYLHITIGSKIGQYGLTAHTFEVVAVTNLPSLKPSSSFALQLQNGGLVLESISDGVYARLINLAHFNTLTVTPSSLVAGEAATYTIQFSHTLSIPSTSTAQLSFTLPSSYLLVSCSACSGYNSFSIVSNTTTLLISKVINPQAVLQSNSIVIKLAIDGYMAIEDPVSSPSFSATTLTYSVTGNSSFMGEVVMVNITVDFLPISTSSLVITIPSQYGIGTLTVYSPQVTISSSLASNTLNLTLTNIVGQNVTIYIDGLTNPVVTASSAWALSAFTSTNIVIGTGTSSNLFTAVCGSNCRECVNSSYCLSCYSNNLVNTLPLLDNTTHTCISACNSSQFLEGGVCYSCDSTCLTCSLFATNCTSCSTSAHFFSGICLSSCPDGYFSSNGTCTLCSNNCLSCSSATTCLSCSNSFILQTDSSCASSCPSGQFNSSNICTVCSANCSSCDASGCLACSGGNYLVQTSTTICVSACPQGLFVSGNMTWCQVCQSPCTSCINTSSTCTTCNALSLNKHLLNNQCLTSCPSATYIDQLNQCQSCVSPCLDCQNATFCTSCQPTYYLYSPLGQCVLSCMSNTITVNNTCQECVSPCLTCSGSTTTCTSCIASFFLVSSNSTCTDNCTAPNVAFNGLCSICVYPCLTCNTSNSSICFSCAATYLIFQSTCYTACPTHTYNDTATTCALCTAPCSECSLSASTCTSCYNDSSLLSGACYNPCPTNYFASNGSCVACQSQCTSCPYSAADQCLSCASAALYHNPVTYHCTSGCSFPYFATTSTPLQCLPCQLPCKSCSVNYNQCSQCYFGNYLLNNLCQSSCPTGYYQDSLNHLCVQCGAFCANCSTTECLTCQPGNYFYAGSCFATCPASAPYVYGIYCRNCQFSNCILCNSQGLCTLCQTGFLLNYNGVCVTACPSGYQPDTLTSSRCIKTPEVAYIEYIQFLEGMKILAMPATLIFTLLLLVLPFAQIKLIGLMFLLTLPQCIALAQFTVLYLFEQTNLIEDIFQLPWWLGYAVVGLHVVLGIVHVCFIWGFMLHQTRQFDKYLDWGANYCRFKTIIAFSLLNKNCFFIVFSGLFKLPMSTLHFKNPHKSFFISGVAYLLFELIAAFLGFFISIGKQSYEYNSKLFFSALDLGVIFLISFIVDLVFICKAKEQPAPTPYKKYIIPKVSTYTLPAVSDPPQNPDQQFKGMHRSGSDQGLFESDQMKKVQYRSVFDPDDFFDQTPNIDTDGIDDALKSGKFRKKKKKKRGERRMGKLGVIEEESDQDEEEEEQEEKKKKKKRKYKEKDIGGLKNYLYWKKPKEKKRKKNPGKIFRENKETIMSRIKQKQSQFDSITQNDIVFQQQFDLNSESDDYNFNADSRRAFQKPPKVNYYDSLFNLNYAQKYHMEDLQ